MKTVLQRSTRRVKLLSARRHRRKPLGPDNVMIKTTFSLVKANVEVVKVQIKVFKGRSLVSGRAQGITCVLFLLANAEVLHRVYVYTVLYLQSKNGILT